MLSNTFYIWYIMLVVQNLANRYAIQWSNSSWMVIDYSTGLHILNLHNEAKAFNFTTKDISIAKEQNYNAGYIFFAIKKQNNH